MAHKRILVQWIGHSDLRAMVPSLPSGKRQEIVDAIKGSQGALDDVGPTRTLLSRETFDEIHLLTNYPSDWGKLFPAWLGQKVRLVQVDLQKPTDYAAIYRVAHQHLTELAQHPGWQDTELCIHLSPGTPAMAAVWVLLGKTRFPATFYETFRGESWITEIPFDLTIDVIPELLRAPDIHLQHLAAHSPGEVAGFEQIAGDSPAIRLAVGRARRAALRSVSVLLLGESGTGKELFARAIHQASPRREQPFVPINCAAISKQLLESELFGHAKGAFTGADRNRKGAFELAHGGTLFLDEVGECDLEMQAKLLRVLQPPAGAPPGSRTFQRVGDEQVRTVDVRIIAATNRDLQHSLQSGQFREDLYYRLAVITVTLPPLRDRKSDIPGIAQMLLAEINAQFRAGEREFQDKSLSVSAIAFVKRHDWPGNVRQLYNVLLQAAVLANGNSLDRSDIIAALGEMPTGKAASGDLRERPLGDGFRLQELLNELHSHYLRRAMDEARGIKADAARLLGIDNYQTLDAQLKRLGVRGNWK